jgi:hypothetical protein
MLWDFSSVVIIKTQTLKKVNKRMICMKKLFVIIFLLIFVSGCQNEPEPTHPVMSSDDCAGLGGRVVNLVGDATCRGDEINVGNVKGMYNAAICCKTAK